MLFGAMSLQNSILDLGVEHRVHHRHVDDVDNDPYSAKRGLWFSHIGWMLRNYPSGTVDLRNARDLESNPIVTFQHDHYLSARVGMNLGVALLLGWWHGDIWGSLLLGGLPAPGREPSLHVLHQLAGALLGPSSVHDREHGAR